MVRCSAEQVCFLTKDDVAEKGYHLDFDNFPQDDSCENRRNTEPVAVDEDGTGTKVAKNEVIKLEATTTCNLQCTEGYYQVAQTGKGDGNKAKVECKPNPDRRKRLGDLQDPLTCKSA